MKPVREQLRDIIRAARMTQTQAAEQLPLSRPLLNRILNGQNQLSPETAMKFERLFGIDARKLLRRQLDEHLRELERSKIES